MRLAALATFVHGIRLIGMIACFAGAPAALSREPKPDASLKSKTFEARVFLEDKVEVDAALSADCLAEGRKWMEKSATEGPYAEGEYFAFVPWETLKANMSREGTRIFAGARPKGDGDDTQ